MSLPRTTRIAIVGAGRGGSALLDLFADNPSVTIAVVVDVDPEAPGMKKARERGIPTETNVGTVFAHTADVVIEVTGQPTVQAELLRLKPPNVEILGASSARLMWDILEKIQQNLTEITALHTIMTAVGQSLDLVVVQEAALTAAMEATQTRRGVIRLLDEETQDLVIAAHRGLSQRYTQGRERLPLQESLAAPAAQQGMVVVVRTEDYPNEHPARAALMDEGIKVFANAPLTARDRLVGYLAVFDPPDGTFPRSQLILLQTMGQQIGLAIDHARVYGQLARAFRELKAAQAKLIASERLTALGEMASGVAHDFNNRLMVILGRTQLLLLKAGDPDLSRGLQLIEQTALESAETVRRMLEFTRRRHDQPSAPIQLASLVEEIIEETRSKTQAQGIALETALEPVPPVLGHAQELREVLTNLISNAVDATPSGGRIILRTWSAGDQVEVSVEDTGVGMSEATAARAFEPFFTTKGPNRAGLGLSLAYGIIVRHQGQIRVSSQEGRGTKVTILFPAAGEAQPTPPSTPQVSPVRILVIDDDEAVREALKEMLATRAHQVTEAASGPEGLALLETTGFDLVFTDLRMPGMTGWEVARQVKARRPGTPVVLITGWGAAIDPNQLQTSEVDRILFKPLQMEELLDTVQVLATGSGREPPRANAVPN
jgi:signal transduction histidine kinase/ActR/RegA family two-component response regulator